ncbi:MAG: imidazolonepropionase [Lysobacterales bacterium]
MPSSAADQRWDRLILASRVATADGGGYGLIDDAAIGIQQGRFCFVGARDRLPAAPDQLADRVETLPDGLLTPGLIDAHTHLVFAGRRADEFERRLAGESYAQIAESGGGIRSTVSQTRLADETELLRSALPRAQALLADGVTTLEIKSGYGLDLETEARQLRTARAVGQHTGQRIRTSYLGAHALPPGYSGVRADYLRQIIDQYLPTLHQRGLIDAVDAYCEGIAFSAEELRPLFERARQLGLPVKLHADQLSDAGGAALAAEYSALSADHLEYTSASGIAALAAAGTVAMILPGAFVVLGETQKPPIAALRQANVPMAVATDLNPGSSPLLSLRAAMHLACALFGLTPTEAFLGVTVHAARALGLHGQCGQIAVGQAADLVWWPLESPVELAYWLGGTPARRIWINGQMHWPV